ncbi:YopX family protein [Bacillus sp. SN1]|uniref:YopX family protein n=1 Tax=Bacillus sp. SN1 TaxID=2055158 RepID=UPI000C22B309|nr:YopX family protein [Bacillus sp. SN1]PJH91848.1 hypothetical protein CVV77_19635 [Bacillus sp. SN1]PSI03455.1 hypothetical protein C7H81_20360 [Bacillus subtilis]
MITAYRVWDGEEMHYGHEEDLTLIIEASGAWDLRRCRIRGKTVAHSHDGKSVLMFGIGFFDVGVIYQADIIKGKRESTWHPGYDKVLGKVEFSKDTYGFYVEGVGAGPLYNIEPNFELLGDVYQNPELLEGAE